MASTTTRFAVGGHSCGRRFVVQRHPILPLQTARDSRLNADLKRNYFISDCHTYLILTALFTDTTQHQLHHGMHYEPRQRYSLLLSQPQAFSHEVKGNAESLRRMGECTRTEEGRERPGCGGGEAIGVVVNGEWHLCSESIASPKDTAMGKEYEMRNESISVANKQQISQGLAQLWASAGRPQGSKAEQSNHLCFSAEQMHLIPVSYSSYNMQGADHMNTAHSSYGVNMVEYGDVGVGSMMALMTEHEPESESVMTSVPSSFSSYNHGQSECLLSAAMFQSSQACQGGKIAPHNTAAGHFVMEQFVPEQTVISESSLSSVKTEVCSSLVPGQFEFRRKEDGRCYAEPSFVVSPIVTSIAPQQEARIVTSLEVDSPCSNEPNDADALKAKIVAHPHYRRLVAAYINCQKIGAPPEVLARLDELSQDYHERQCLAAINIGVDPELDEFMESYCEMFNKYEEELMKPYNEAMAFFNKIETQLNSLGKTTIRTTPSG
eukprot:Gb_00573 [translate_table: standard]